MRIRRIAVHLFRAAKACWQGRWGLAFLATALLLTQVNLSQAELYPDEVLPYPTQILTRAEDGRILLRLYVSVPLRDGRDQDPAFVETIHEFIPDDPNRAATIDEMGGHTTIQFWNDIEEWFDEEIVEPVVSTIDQTLKYIGIRRTTHDLPRTNALTVLFLNGDNRDYYKDEIAETLLRQFKRPLEIGIGIWV